ncbi:MAG TPA: hypothetical protein VH207_05550 [Chthoniobacterales bacterium]|jgi:hypothetical protein|nr:hypothetical protein [Chthoniobacterales bacterium]
MSKQVSEIAEAAARSAQPYRRHIIGLPLQRSLFGRIGRAATTIGLPGLSSESDFPARLDENGDLFLDRSQVAALSKALSSWFTPETLDLMRTTHAAACDALLGASENAARAGASPDGAARKLSEDLANKLALVLAYGILSKFVPDVLLRALADAGDVEPPPFPETSAGAKLMENMFALYQACCVLNYPPERLQREWPRVSPEAFQLVTEFCNRQTGFGPLAWDSPGYEDPNYVVRLLHSAFDGVDAEQVRQRLSFAKRPAIARSPIDRPTKIAALRHVLAFWLNFLERETWFVRRAFYVGMIPLLRHLAAGYRQKIPAFQLTDVLFLDICELVAGIADPAMIHARRDRYMENTEYLSLQGVDSARLATMLGSS